MRCQQLRDCSPWCPHSGSRTPGTRTLFHPPGMHCPTPGLQIIFFMKQWRHSLLASFRRTTGNQNLCRYPVHFQNCTPLIIGSYICSGFISETRHQMKSYILFITYILVFLLAPAVVFVPVVLYTCVHNAHGLVIHYN
jgi:hypothetical protein